MRHPAGPVGRPDVVAVVSWQPLAGQELIPCDPRRNFRARVTKVWPALKLVTLISLSRPHRLRTIRFDQLEKLYIPVERARVTR